MALHQDHPDHQAHPDPKDHQDRPEEMENLDQQVHPDLKAMVEKKEATDRQAPLGHPVHVAHLENQAVAITAHRRVLRPDTEVQRKPKLNRYLQKYFPKNFDDPLVYTALIFLYALKSNFFAFSKKA